jgi:hypothetical protein
MYGRELLDRLGERIAVDDLLLLSTLMNQQQQDPNALSNLVNALLVTRLIGSRPGIEGVLLATTLLNMNSSQSGTGAATPMGFQNILPLLLLMGVTKEEESDVIRRWKVKEDREKEGEGQRAH